MKYLEIEDEINPFNRDLTMSEKERIVRNILLADKSFINKYEEMLGESSPGIISTKERINRLEKWLLAGRHRKNSSENSENQEVVTKDNSPRIPKHNLKLNDFHHLL